ncbi:unnamed protein product [Urochloa humidicola]
MIEDKERGLTMPWATRRRAADSPPMANRQPQRLYLVLDDYPWGYSIRELLPPFPSKTHSPRRHKNKGVPQCLPQPIICFEAPRGCPLYFTAIGTRIVATHRRDLCGDQSVPVSLPIVDVRWRGVTFGPCQVGPCQVYPNNPIYLPVQDELFVLDTSSFRKLSFKPLWPPRLESSDTSTAEWSWCELPQQPFDRIDVTSYAILGQNILFSTEAEGEPTWLPDEQTLLPSTETYPATFALDTVELEWKRYGNWMLPFTGRAFFVSRLQAFVGLSKDLDTSGHLCCCKAEATDDPPVWKLGKENLFSEDPDESHVGATLINIGRNVFCLVQCVSIEDGSTADQKLQEGQLEKGGEVSQCCCYLYRLTTFSLSYDDNGDLTTGGTCQVQCYKVPEQTSEKFLRENPVAFWL